MRAGQCAIVFEVWRALALRPEFRTMVRRLLMIERQPCRSGENSATFIPHWRELSRRVRFERAHGRCQDCGRPHSATIRCLADGRWFDSAQQTWRDRRGRTARWPDLKQMVQIRTMYVVLAAAHLAHDATNSGH
jgi:hypothetical protein